MHRYAPKARTQSTLVEGLRKNLTILHQIGDLLDEWSVVQEADVEAETIFNLLACDIEEPAARALANGRGKIAAGEDAALTILAEALSGEILPVRLRTNVNELADHLEALTDEMSRRLHEAEKAHSS